MVAGEGINDVEKEGYLQAQELRLERMGWGELRMNVVENIKALH